MNFSNNRILALFSNIGIGLPIFITQYLKFRSATGHRFNYLFIIYTYFMRIYIKKSDPLHLIFCSIIIIKLYKD